MKTPVHLWRFKSSSGTGTYETLKYDDGSTSCDCMGWTRRCVNNQRTCKHTRAVESGDAEQLAASHSPVGAGHVVSAAVEAATKPIIKQSTFARKFC